MLPLLHLAADGAEHFARQASDRLADEFHLTQEERAELLPSGRQTIFDNRVGWARTYLKKAGLLDSPVKGRFHITPQGREVLATKPTSITTSLLDQFPEFREFHHPADKQPHTNGDPKTPEELLETTFQALRESLGQDVLERVKQASPQFFERLVVELLVAMGYGGSLKDAGSVIGRSGDDGIDGIDGTIKEDRLGLDVIYIQAKRWSDTVSRPAVQAFAGSLEGQRARKGVFITTSRFSADARDYVNRIEKRIVLIDGEQLAKYMIGFGLGVADVETYDIKRLDLDYFVEE